MEVVTPCKLVVLSLTHQQFFFGRFVYNDEDNPDDDFMMAFRLENTKEAQTICLIGQI
jgi:hypothetical protein